MNRSREVATVSLLAISQHSSSPPPTVQSTKMEIGIDSFAAILPDPVTGQVGA